MNRKYFVVTLIAYMVLMIVVHLLRGGMIPLDTFMGMDKVLHMIEYVIFAFLCINALKNPNFNKIIAIIIFGTSFGILIEFLQMYVAGRYASTYDAIANVIGLLIGSVITYKYLIISNDKEPIH